jgi:hypothetical protein
MFTIDRCVVVTLRLRGGRMQTGKIRRTILAAPMQERGAAQRNRRPLRSRSEQHGQDPEQHVVADDDFGREILQ